MFTRLTRLSCIIVTCTCLMTGTVAYAADFTIDGGDTVDMQLSKAINDYVVCPGDEIRENITIENTSSDTYQCVVAEDGFDTWTSDVVYVGYRDATELDVDGQYDGKQREVTGGGHDVQAHIDSGKWVSIYDYFNGMTLTPGQMINVGVVMSFDGILMDNTYQMKEDYYEAYISWIKLSTEPEDGSTETPASEEPMVSGVTCVCTTQENTTQDIQVAVADEIYVPTYDVVRCTYYTAEQGYFGATASGVCVRDGILAGPAEWIGRSCTLLSLDGEVIGEYVFEDTGNPKYVNENRIDMWFSTNAEGQQYTSTYGDYVIIQWR